MTVHPHYDRAHEGVCGKSNLGKNVVSLDKVSESEKEVGKKTGEGRRNINLLMGVPRS